MAIDNLTLYDKNHIMSRIEKFLFAICSLDSSDLPIPLSRIEELYNCLVTGDTPPTFDPLSRAEKFLMACLGGYDINKLPEPLSRSEVLLKKIATGDSNLEDVDNLQSKYEFLLAYIIQNGGIGGIDGDISYMKYTLTEKETTLYNTKERSVRSAILKGMTDKQLTDMVSVKMPVLTTVGKNLFDKNKKITNDKRVSTSNGFLYSQQGYSVMEYFEINPNTTYTLTHDNRAYCAEYDEDKNFIRGFGWDNGVAITTQSNTRYIRLDFPTDKIDIVQIEKGSTATSFEPFKSNILTCNEEVTLRGIGDVKDELNLLTGELTQSLVERVFDGTENWIIGGTGGNYKLFRCESYTDMVKSSNIIVSDKYAYSTVNNASSNLNITHSTTTGKPCIVTSQVDLSLDDFKSKLSVDKPRVQYQLAEKVVKTVDLSIVDQDGNNTELSTFDDITYVTLSSEGLIPEVELEVATKNEEVLNTLSLEMDDISTAQTTLEETSNTQSENVDATMIATTEIYEGLL